MLIMAVPAALYTLATFALALLWRLVLALRRRKAPGFWGRTLRWHAGLFVLHFFVTAPVVLGVTVSRNIGTRRDERDYGGPRIAKDGTWLEQSRESLAAEAAGTTRVDPAVSQAAARHAVAFTARDGVKLRGFLVAPNLAPGESPRFVAVLVHGLFRGALEIETPGRMLRDLGGEVLLLEMRNHGGSGRARPTFGRDEAEDVLAGVEFLRARPEARGRPLVLYAVSLGTAAVALAAPRVPDLGGLVLDAPIDDLGPTARRWLRSFPPMQAIVDPWASILLWTARVPVDDVRPVKALAGLRPEVAVLLIGAGKDARATPESVRALFAALPTAPDRKELWMVPEASHGKVWITAADEYRRKLARLCDEAVETPRGSMTVRP